MAINKKLIHFKTKAAFDKEVANNILDTSIVFIKDALLIYTHGLYYTCKDWANNINNLQELINTLVSGNASTAIESFNEIISFLSNIEDSENLDAIIASLQTLIGKKQNIISDLDTIRAGAAKGATALQSYTEKYTGTVTGIKINGSTKTPTSGVVNLGTVITAHQDISGKLDSTTAASTYLTKTDAADLYQTKGTYVTGVKGSSESTYRNGNVSISPANLGITVVNNTADANKPISTATQTALNAKAPLASPALTGTPTAPTATAGTNTTQIATTAFVKSEIDSKTVKFTNKTASSWVSDSTYSDYPYRCDISCSGITADHYAEVVFDVEQTTSGNYAPVCETKSNIVSIWSSKQDSITIPTIIIIK